MALPSIITGNRITFDDQDDHILDIEEGIKFLNPRDNGIKFVKKLLANSNGGVAKSYKHEWNETALPVRKETITLADALGTSVTVANAYGYQVGDILLVDSERMRVTALADTTTLTVTRAYGGTTGAAHASKVMYNLGSAEVENALAPAGTTLNSDRKYNYVQTFARSVDMSNDEIAQLSAEMGNPFNAQLERITLYFWKLFAQAAFYGSRYEDSTNKIHTMGGIDYFISTNANNVAGANTITLLDNLIESIVNAGGNADTIVVGTAQKRKLDALDTNLVHLDSKNNVGGGTMTSSWRSGLQNEPLDIIVDHSIKPDELYVLDSSKISLKPLVNNGVNGRLSVYDATTPGQDGKKKVLRGKYTLQFDLEAGMGKQYGLT